MASNTTAVHHGKLELLPASPLGTQTSFTILDAHDATQSSTWEHFWKSWPDREVFAHPHYLRLVARPQDRTLCAFSNTANGVVLFPFLLRPICTEPWAANDDIHWDIISPYGYGGAFTWACQEELAKTFFESFAAWIKANSVVSSFVRLSLFPDQVLPLPGMVEVLSQNIVRRLDRDIDHIWTDYEHKVRKNVKRAQRSELTCEFDMEGNRLDEFLDIYYGTMDRRQALEHYYFDREFFESLIRNLQGQFAFVHVCQDQKVVSTELILLSRQHVYSFLGGTRSEAFALRPNDLLKHEVIRWAQQEGKHAFVLGGGYNPGDGIFRYKKAFAPNGVVDFRVAKIIHDTTAYTQLVMQRKDWELREGRQWEAASGFFPEYRG